MDGKATIEVELGTAVLTVAEVWPDGDAPANPTADDVVAAMADTGSARRVVDDWCLLDDLEVTVRTPNPEWRQSESLMPEHAAERWTTTKATHS